MSDMDWRDRAACLGEDPELFFPIGTTGPGLRQVAQAKSVCRGCPVAVECLAWALDTDQRQGVWGGLSEDERLELRQRCYSVSRRPSGLDLPPVARPLRSATSPLGVRRLRSPSNGHQSRSSGVPGRGYGPGEGTDHHAA